MTEKELNGLLDIVKAPGWESHRRLQEYLKTAEVTSVEVEQKYPSEGISSPSSVPSKRTSSQNRALHKGMTLLADSLNNAGLDMRVLLRPSISLPWTGHSVKEHLFKPFMHLMTGKESTTELEKASGEIEKIWDTLMRELGEKHGIEAIPFPCEPMKGLKIGAYDNAQRDNYPEYNGAPTI